MDALDLSLYSTYAVVRYIDWRQTQYIAQNPLRFHETNPRLQRHPTVHQVNRFFLKATALDLGVSALLPKPYDRLWVGGLVVQELGYTTHNRSIGIKFEIR